MEPYGVFNRSNSSICNETLNQDVNAALLWLSLGLAIAVLIGLSFTYRRARFLSQCLLGFPGITQPVNLLTFTPDRAINVVLFGALSGEIYNSLYEYHNNFGQLEIDPYLSILLTTVAAPVLSVLELSIKYFPLFACVDSPIPVLGHIVGLLYLPFVVTHIIYRDVFLLTCSLAVVYNQVIVGLYIAGRAPTYLAFLWIIIWYLYSLFKDTVVSFKLGFQEAMKMLSGNHRMYEYYRECVQHLLRRKDDPQSVSCVLQSKVLSYLCPCLTSAKRLPLPFMAAITATSFFLFQTTLLLSGVLFYGLSELNNLVIDNEVWLTNRLGLNINVYNVLKDITQSLLVVIPTSPLLSWAICMAILIHLIRSVHKNLQQAARGNFKLPKTFSSFRLAASLRYAGYQVAFAITAFFAYSLVLWLLGAVGLLAYFGLKYNKDATLQTLAGIVIPVCWFCLVAGIQILACKLLFLKTGGGKFIIISNKKLFQWFSYYLFIYNAGLGLVSAILRVFVSSTLSLVMMMRLDRTILMKGFEFFDLGHTTYLGFLHLDYTYNNAVVHVFVKLMGNIGNKNGTRMGSPTLRFGNWSDLQDENLAFEGDAANIQLRSELPMKSYGVVAQSEENASVSKANVSRRMRNRWLVAYTLIRNPSIQCLTASNIQGQLDHSTTM